MSWWRWLARVTPSIFHRRRDERDLQAEIDFHLDQEARLRRDRGVTHDQAIAAARRDFGNVTLVKEATRAMWGWTSIDRAAQDFRYACRTLMRTPAFAAVAVVSLGLGIGANTAVFRLLDAVRLRHLPVESPDELAEVQMAHPRSRVGSFRGRRPEFTFAQWEQINEHQQAFSGLVAWSTTVFNLAPSGEARYATGLWVSGDFFRVLGVEPMLGRVLTAQDDRRGCDAGAAVISHGFWQRELGGQSSVIGRTLTLERRAFTIVGVTPQEFYGVEVGRTFDVAVPLCTEPLIRADNAALDKRDSWWLAVIGRLEKGWTIDQASSHLRGIATGVFEATVPPAYRPELVEPYLALKLTAVPAASGVSNLRRDYETPLYVLWAISGLVLLIACANVANLLLARANGRQGELAVRVAIGASRTRLVHQLVIESLVLAAAGAVLGAIVAGWVSRALVAFLTTERTPLHLDLPMDWRVLGFLTVLALLTCLASGLIPAFRATRVTPARVIQAVGRGLTATRERFRLQRTLVVSQVAVSLVLLFGALLFIRTLSNLASVNLGFDPENILIVDIDVPGHPLDRRPAIVQQLHERLRAIPGVQSIAHTTIVPLSGSGANNNVWMEGTPRENHHLAQMSTVSPGYFATVGTRFKAGRDFDERDTLNSPKVAIVTETFVRTVAGGTNPIGRRFIEPGDTALPDQPYQIIGIVEDTKYSSVRDEIEPIAFMAASQVERPSFFPAFLLRVAGPPEPVFDWVRRAAPEVHPGINLDFGVLATNINQTLQRERLVAMLATAFASLAVLLVTLGLYGVLSYMVTRRNNEIGIRIALGAGRGKVAGMFAREAGTLVVVGLVIGLALAVATGQLASGLLYGLQPSDPATLAMAAAVLAVIAIVAAYLPAWRAARVDPVVALRSE